MNWAVETLAATALLMAAVLLLRNPVARLFGPRAAYALWLAPLLRLVVPPLPSAPAILPGPLAAEPAQYWIETGQAASPGSPLGLLLGFVWVGGALLYLAVQWARHQDFIADALAHGRALHVDGVACDVVASSRIEGPMATGLIHPLILVPDDFAERFTPEQQRFALLHEQLHHRRGDIWASAAALVLASLHWFNPIAHLALGAFRRDMEAACDASVLSAAGAAAAPDYAQTILRCAARPAPRSLCALTSIDELKGRLTMLKLNHGPGRRAAGLACALLLAGGGLTLSSGLQAHPHPEGDERIEKKIIVHKIAGPGGELPAELRDKMAKCEGEKVEATAAAQAGAGKRENVRIVLCGKKGATPAELAAMLEKSVGRIEAESDLSPERKAQILAQLRAKIAELRAR